MDTKPICKHCGKPVEKELMSDGNMEWIHATNRFFRCIHGNNPISDPGPLTYAEVMEHADPLLREMLE